MKYIKRILILVLMLSFFSVNAKEEFKICTPTDDYKKYSSLSKKEKSKYIEPIYCNDIVTKKDKSSSYGFSFRIKQASITDSKYSSVEENLITPVKNQDPLGTCWAFSAIGAVESNALKNNLALYDFSESHMVYSLVSGAYKDNAGKNGRYFTTDMDGGTLMYAPTYYFNGYGQLLEEEMPYETNQSKIYSSEYVQGRKIITLKEFGYDNLSSTTEACTTDFMNNIKQKILKYGSVQATMYMDQLNNFSDEGENYYLAKNTDETEEDDYVNHGILIVGWDDSISKSRFNGATRNGAWIIKNSWGPTWSNDGYFYISYDDEFICNGVATFGGVSDTTYDYTYKAADLVGNLYFNLTNKVYFSSKFTKQSTTNEILKRVSFSTGKYSSYKVYLSKENELEDKTNWIELGEGTSTMYGIESIDIPDEIVIDDDYTIITEYNIEEGKTSSIFSMCDINDDTTHLDYSTGINHASFNGTTWTDFGTVNDIYHCEPNIWAYTDEVIPDPTLTVTNPVVVRNKVTFDLIYQNVKTNEIVYKVEGRDNEDVTDHFTITPNYTTNKLTIVSDNTISGPYALVATYNDLTASQTFRLEISITVEDDTTMNFDDLNLKVAIPKDSSLSLKNLTDNINNNNVEIEIYNSKGTKVEDEEAVLGTGSTIKAGNEEYTIVLIGDSTGDGKIDSADLLKVVRYLKGTTTLSQAQIKASDSTNNNVIDSADLLKVVRYLKGTTTFGV